MSAGPGTRAADVAAAIRAIAYQRNALRLGGTSNSIRTDTAAYHETAEAFSDEVVESFEKQAVTLVSYNEKRRTVYIYTTKRVPKGEASVLPLALPSDVKITYRVTKPLIISDSEVSEPFGADPYELFKQRYACGSSISIGNTRAAGTIGALVRDNKGTLFGLSNNHVSGGCSNARAGLPIVAPGIMDVMVGSHNPFTIGLHHAILPMRPGDPSVASGHEENSDAALFSIVDEALVTSWQGQQYDTPEDIVDPVDDMIVEKVGRTTKHTQGNIDSRVSGPFPVQYKSVTYHSPEDSSTFIGQVFFNEVYLVYGKNGTLFSKPGDSGSLVVTTDNGIRKAVGLVFAGKTSGESYILPLRSIVERFKVKLVSGLGV